MAYTAINALEDAQTALLAQEAKVIATFQKSVFDRITAAAQLGKTTVMVQVSKDNYAIVQPILVKYEYTVSAYDAQGITIQWSTIESKQAVKAIQPTQLHLIKSVPYTSTFYYGSSGATSFTVTNGQVPAGLTYSNGAITGTPTIVSDGFFEITDSSSNTAIINWTVTSNELDSLDLKNKTVVPVPTTRFGNAGDSIGDIAYDTVYMYVCIANYTTGSTNVWWRIPKSGSSGFSTSW